MDLRAELQNLERDVLWTIADHASFEDVLQRCGLNTARDRYHEIDRDTARLYLIRIFYADLAYDHPEMSLDRATALTDAFLAEFRTATSQFYSNGNANSPSERSLPGVVQLRSWNRVGTATFDWGVVVVSPERSGCVWAGDED